MLSPPVYVMQEDGFGMAPLEYVTQRGPQQHGETVLAMWLRPRTIDLIVRKNGCSRSEFWSIRQTLMNIMRPNRMPTPTPGILRKYMADGRVREWFVYTTGGLSLSSHDPNQWDEYSVRDSIRFTCFDPVARDPTPKSATFISSGTVATFPLTFPLTIAAITPGAGMNTMSFGTWDTYPTIVINGPASGVIISNLTTDERIELSYPIPSGRVVTVDLAYGRKSVVLDDGTNLIGYLTPESDIGTFHLKPGSNNIQVYASGTSSITSTTLTWYDKDIGV